MAETILSLKTAFSLKYHGNCHPEVFCKKVVLKDFTEFKGKNLRRSLFIGKV